MGARPLWSDFLCLSCHCLVLRSRSCESTWHEDCKRRVHLFPAGQDPAHCLHQEELQRSVSGDRIQQQKARQAVLRQYTRTKSNGRPDSLLAIKRFLRRHDAIDNKSIYNKIKRRPALFYMPACFIWRSQRRFNSLSLVLARLRASPTLVESTVSLTEFFKDCQPLLSFSPMRAVTDVVSTESF